MKIVTLTLNPAFDLHCHIEKFAPYHENLAKITDYSASGKGVNISRALTVCGVENMAFVVLGEENGAAFEKDMLAAGMTYRALTVPGRIRENITIHTEGADETRISFEGFRADATLTERVSELLEPEIDNETFVTFTGRVAAGMEIQAAKDFLRRLEARGAKIVIDSKSFSLDDLLEMKPWLIKPNEEEISEYLKRPIETFEEVLCAAEELHEQGIANVMISLGAKGALLVCEEGAFVATPPRIHAVSTIGAGDSSIGGFLAAAIEGATGVEMLCRAVSYGTAACLTEGTRPPRAEDVTAILPQINLEKKK